MYKFKPSVLVFGFVFGILFTSCSLLSKTSESKVKLSCEGNWEVTVSDTPYGDVRGNLKLFSKDGELKGTLSSPLTGKQEVKNLSLKGNRLTGSIEAMGMGIILNGMIQGDVIAGSASADGYNFPYKAVKKH
jgi:hypothetical protein